MNKYIILAIVLVVFMFGFTDVKAQVAKLWDSTVRLPKGYSQEIYSDVIDKSGVKIMKFNDNGTVCYVAYGNKSNSPSIHCK